MAPPRRWQRVLAAATTAAAAILMVGESVAGIDCTFGASYPKQYVAYHTEEPPLMDGRLDDSVWEAVPFSDDFVDISTAVTPRFRTRMKMRWDASFLYVGAYLEEPQVWANISKHDEVIFHDNDFEVFVDPSSSTHFYKETEINARNYTWDLCLNKPYLNGGYENSSRVFGARGFDMQPPLHARTFVKGSLNDPSLPSDYWTVELALPIDGLLLNATGTHPHSLRPAPGRFWRINFSRVEWHVRVVGGHYEKVPNTVEDNWVWQAIGVVDMHLPERWGMLQFADGRVNATKPVRNDEWPLRAMAAALYDAEQAYAAKHNGSFTADVAKLLPFAAPHTIDGSCSQPPVIQVRDGDACDWAGAKDASRASPSCWSASIASERGSMVARIRSDRYTVVDRRPPRQ